MGTYLGCAMMLVICVIGAFISHYANKEERKNAEHKE